MFAKRNGRLSIFFVLILLFGFISASPIVSKGKGKTSSAPAKAGGGRANTGPRAKLSPSSPIPKGKGQISPAPKRGPPKGSSPPGATSCKKPPQQIRKRFWGSSTPDFSRMLLIGYKGINAARANQPPATSGGGELGDVLYVADHIDLAKSFAYRNPGESNQYLCRVYVNPTEWAKTTKVWVNPAGQSSTTMDRYAPGSVLFAVHTNAGLGQLVQPVPDVYQLGIRRGDINKLQVAYDCQLAGYFCYDHSTLWYPGKGQTWGIQDPNRLVSRW